MISAVLLLISATLSHGAPALPVPPLVQIAIVRQAPSAMLFCDDDIQLIPPRGSRRMLGWRGELALKPREGGLRLATEKIKSETRLVPKANGIIRVNGHAYRGTLILRLELGQTITIIEESSLEDYLEGVLPHEMDPEWPLEALKAQAVVARTFAYANLGKFKKEGFDLTADTSSQMYRGLTAVNERVKAAVKQTRGEVLGYGGKLLRVYYHSCCGGATTDVGTAWRSDGPSAKPLKGVRDPWCRLSPHMNWTAYFTWADLTAALSDRQALSDPPTSLKIGERDSAGYVRTFVARSKRESSVIRASDLRAALGSNELKSQKIKTIRSRKNGVEFIGSGMGHGVGLCQWGARAQADKGRDYAQILRFYFPGSDLSEIEL